MWPEKSPLKNKEIGPALGPSELQAMGSKKVFGVIYKSYKNGSLAEALEMISAAKKIKDKLPQEIDLKLSFLEADIFLDLKQYDRGEQCYSEILIKTQSDVAYANKALCQWELGELGAALGNYLRALNLNPENEVALRCVGDIYLELDMPAEAAAYYEKAIRIDVTSVEAIAGLGIAYLRTGKCVEACQLLKKVLEQVPDHNLALQGLKRIKSINSKLKSP